MIDDITVNVSENVAINTLITDTSSVPLLATSSRGTVKYFLSKTGPPELNGLSDFIIPSPNPLNGTAHVPIATGRNLDASVLSSYVLRCRAYVGVCYIIC